MARILTEPEMMDKAMKVIADVATHIVHWIRDSLKCLQSVNQKMKLIHESMTPARSEDDGTSSHQQTILAVPRTEKHVIRYRILQENLKKHPCTNQLN